MQNVSEKWKENQESIITSEAFIEVTYDVTDPEVLSDATASDDGTALAEADTASIVDGSDKDITPYAVFEMNRWVLDGENVHVPDDGDYGDTGYVSALLSDEDGYFSSNPIIDITFSKVHTPVIPGITIVWDDVDYASDLKITIYQGDVVQKEYTATGSEPTTIVEADISNYDRIRIEVLRWCLPYRRARAKEVFIGIHKIYDKTDLMSYSQSISVDPLSAELPNSSISFSIDNTDNEYNPESDNSWTKYMIERQEVSVRYGFKIENGVEWINGGTFYLSSWDAPQNGLTASFEAKDLIEFLSETYLRGVYNPSGTSLYELAENVLIDANLPLAVDGLNRWVIDESLRDIYTTAPLPASPRSECLEMIANAGKCVIYTDRVGTLHIEKRDYEITDYVINDFNSYSRTEVSLTKPLSQVEVKCYTYFPEDGESREIYKGTLDVNGIETYIFAYSTPSADAQATVTGGEIIEATYYTNACWLTVEGTGSVDVSIIGHELKNSESTVIVIADDPTGEKQAVENPLITSSDVAKGIGNWVKEFYANRKTFSSDFRIDPRLDALDVVRISNPFSENDVLLTDVNIDFTGAFKGKTEGRAV